jgi:hypothetical protein
MANLTTAATTVEHSTEKSAVIHIVPEMTNVTTASANAVEHSTEHPAAVHVVKEMTNLTTAAMNSTEKPAHVTAEMMPSTTAVPAISSEKPTHVTEAMNKTNEVTTGTVKTTSSMPETVVTTASAPVTSIRREKRQADKMTTKKPVVAITTKKSIPTTKKPLVPTTPVFGRRFSTMAPITVTRRARQGTTVRPSASRASTIKPVNPTTKPPVKLSPTSNVHIMPVTMKPHPVTTGSVTPKA